MKILITGSKGQLGTAMQRVLAAHSDNTSIESVVAVDVDALDLTDAHAVRGFIANNDFTHIVNCAAFTAVDAAEEEKAACAAVNVDAVKNLALAAADKGIRLVHISTDYVFDGTAHLPYHEGDKPHPLSEYGSSKRKGEMALVGLLPDAVIVRTGWLYSPWGKNFVKTMLRLGAERERVAVVGDQIGTPTYAMDLAEAIYAIITHRQWMPGIYHYSNEGVASWYDFATAIMDFGGRTGCTVLPIHSDEYPVAAARPAYSVLDKTLIKKTFGIAVPHWIDGLRRCMQLMAAEE